MAAKKETKAQKAKRVKQEEAAAAAAAETDSAAASGTPEETPSKGELTDSVIHGGRVFAAGTKVSDIKPTLTGDDKDRLERLGLIA